MSRQFGDVGRAFAERRDVDFKRIDAIHQVLAKIAVLDHLFQISMRGTNDTDVDLLRFVVSDAAYFAAFQHSQQLGLHRLRQLADLVQEQRAAVRHFEQSDTMFIRAREGSLAMPEQLAFDQRFGQRSRN